MVGGADQRLANPHRCRNVLPSSPATDRQDMRMTVPGLGRVVMVVPTYNEAENLQWIVGRLRAAQPAVDILIVDDGSPDGTGRLADELAAADPRSRSSTA